VFGSLFRCDAARRGEGAKLLSFLSLFPLCLIIFQPIKTVLQTASSQWKRSRSGNELSSISPPVKTDKNGRRANVERRLCSSVSFLCAPRWRYKYSLNTPVTHHMDVIDSQTSRPITGFSLSKSSLPLSLSLSLSLSFHFFFPMGFDKVIYLKITRYN